MKNIKLCIDLDDVRGKGRRGVSGHYPDGPRHGSKGAATMRVKFYSSAARNASNFVSIQMEDGGGGEYDE